MNRRSLEGRESPLPPQGFVPARSLGMTDDQLDAAILCSIQVSPPPNDPPLTRRHLDVPHFLPTRSLDILDSLLDLVARPRTNRRSTIWRLDVSRFAPAGSLCIADSLLDLSACPRTNRHSAEDPLTLFCIAQQDRLALLKVVNRWARSRTNRH